VASRPRGKGVKLRKGDYLLRLLISPPPSSEGDTFFEHGKRGRGVRGGRENGAGIGNPPESRILASKREREERSCYETLIIQRSSSTIRKPKGGNQKWRKQWWLMAPAMNAWCQTLAGRAPCIAREHRGRTGGGEHISFLKGGAHGEGPWCSTKRRRRRRTASQMKCVVTYLPRVTERRDLG